MTRSELLTKKSEKVKGAVKKAASLFLALTLVMSLGLTSLAGIEKEETYDYYVKETNTDYSDPVYILLDESNSTVDQETQDRVLNEEAKDPLKIYSEVEKIAQETNVVYEITSEETEVSNLEVGQTYSFIEGDDAQIGDVLDAVPDGGAELEYIGDGRSEGITDTWEYDPEAGQSVEVKSSKSDKTVQEIFEGDIALVEDTLNSADDIIAEQQKKYDKYKTYREKYDNGVAADSVEGILLYFEYSESEFEEGTFDNAKTVDDIVEIMFDNEYKQYVQECTEESPDDPVPTKDEFFDLVYEEYKNYMESRHPEEQIPSKEAYLEEMRNEEKDSLIYDATYLKEYVCSLRVQTKEHYDRYTDFLEKMKAVDATDKEAILEYYGMTEDEVQFVKGNMLWSNTPVTSNLGFVDVIKAGKGFDDCEQGAIFYDEDLGWSYACTGGGVDFGEASDLHLYKIEEKEIEAGAFKVLAGDTVQLNENGTGVAGFSNVKAYCTIGGVEKEIITFEFIDNYVDLNDCHVTAKVGGKYFTVTLNLKKWKEDPAPYIPIEDIEPIEDPEKIEELEKIEKLTPAPASAEDPEEPTPAPAPKVYNVSTDDFVVTKKTVNNAKIDGQSWYGYQYEPVFEKKTANSKDVTDYLDKCISRGKELITFTPSGLDTTGVIDLGAALSKVNDKEKVRGLDFSSVTINENADLSNAFTGYTSLEIIDVSNWRIYNGTFEKAGLASGSGQNIFYYNDLTNKEYINKLEALGWVGEHENLDLSNWIEVDPSFVEWAGLVEKKTFTYNAATAQAYIDYLTALGWTGINESAG